MTASEPREWLIRKRGYYYRPDRAGYTSSVDEAGRYTEAEAKAEAAIEPSIMSAVHQSAVGRETSRSLSKSPLVDALAFLEKEHAADVVALAELNAMTNGDPLFTEDDEAIQTFREREALIARIKISRDEKPVPTDFERTRDAMIAVIRTLPAESDLKAGAMRMLGVVGDLMIGTPCTDFPGLPVSQEPKYTVLGGRLINRATGKPIPDDEPVFVLRAKDRNAVHMIMHYRSMCLGNVEHYHAVDARVGHFLRFAEQHPLRMKSPDTSPGEFYGHLPDCAIRGAPGVCSCGETARKLLALTAPRGKPCTCDNCLGSSTTCRVEAGEKLGELWYCRKAAERSQPDARLTQLSVIGTLGEENERLKQQARENPWGLRRIPSAWMRIVRIASTPDQPPGEYDVECYAGDEPPDGSTDWIPLYRRAESAA
jgi:hypothetical protein